MVNSTHLSSPTMINGIFWLNAIRVSRTFFRGTTCWLHIGLYLLTLISKTNTFPSVVTAANTVDEYGAHLTSPTLAPKSNIKSGSLKMNLGHGLSLSGECLQQIPSHIFPDFDSPIGATRYKYAWIVFIEIDAIDGQIVCLICHQVTRTKFRTAFKYQPFFGADEKNVRQFRMENHTCTAAFQFDIGAVGSADKFAIQK